jgi:tetratricopeptide (TPR) repeat protein
MADAYFLRGVSKMNLGDHRGAILDFTAAINVNPINSNYFLYRGVSKERLYDYKGAMEDYIQAIEIRPINKDAYINRGLMFIRNKKYDEAIKDFDFAISIDFKNSYSYLYRAIGKQAKSLNALAMLDFNKAIQLDIYNAEAYLRRGANKYDMKDYKAAIEDFNHALSIDSSNSYTYYTRALAKYELFDFDGTMQDYNKVLSLDPDNALTYYNRAELKSRKNDFKGAIEDYDKVISINPTNVYTYFNRAYMYYRLNKYYKAIDDYTNAINLNPDFATAYFNRSIVRAAVNDMKGAALDYDIATKKNKEFGKMAKTNKIDSTGLAKLIEFQADFEAGNIQVKKAVESGMYPFSNFVVSYSLTDSLKKFKWETTKSLNDLNTQLGLKDQLILTCVDNQLPLDSANQKVKELSDLVSRPENFAKYFERAVLKFKSQNYSGAIDDYTLAIKLMPNSSLAYFNRANARFEMLKVMESISLNANSMSYIGKQQKKEEVEQFKDYKDVVADYSKCFAIDTSFYYAYFNLANISIESNDFNAALNYFNKAISLKSDFSEAYYNRGLTYIYLKQKNEGCSDISKAGELGVLKSYAVIKKYCK